MRMLVLLVAGILVGSAVTLGALLLSGERYEYRLLNPHDCAMLQVGAYDLGDWVVAPNRPSLCYLRRAHW